MYEIDLLLHPTSFVSPLSVQGLFQAFNHLSFSCCCHFGFVSLVILTTSAVPFVRSCYFHFMFGRNDLPHDAGELFQAFGKGQHLALGRCELDCLVRDIFEHCVCRGLVFSLASLGP